MKYVILTICLWPILGSGCCLRSGTSARLGSWGGRCRRTPCVWSPASTRSCSFVYNSRSCLPRSSRAAAHSCLFFGPAPEETSDYHFLFFAIPTYFSGAAGSGVTIFTLSYQVRGPPRPLPPGRPSSVAAVVLAGATFSCSFQKSGCFRQTPSLQDAKSIKRDRCALRLVLCSGLSESQIPGAACSVLRSSDLFPLT